MTSWTDYQDDISDAISDSMDMDWGANDGARAVVRWLNENKPLSTTPRVTVPVDMNCPKCGARSGDDWEQCGGRCPMPGSPHYSAAPAPEGGAVMKDIAAERRRQIEVEGWTAEHDDEHGDYSLGLAAAAYAGGVDCGSKVATYTDDMSGGRGETPVLGVRKKRVPVPWPDSWDPRWWKPTGDRRRDLIKAAALIVAEIERLDRAGAQK